MFICMQIPYIHITTREAFYAFTLCVCTLIKRKRDKGRGVGQLPLHLKVNLNKAYKLNASKLQIAAFICFCLRYQLCQFFLLFSVCIYLSRIYFSRVVYHPSLSLFLSLITIDCAQTTQCLLFRYSVQLSVCCCLCCCLFFLLHFMHLNYLKCSCSVSWGAVNRLLIAYFMLHATT